MDDAQVGIIGGSGLYRMDGLSGTREVDITTPFGYPSDSIVLGNYLKTQVAFLPRHGRGHFIAPGEIPVQAKECLTRLMLLEQYYFCFLINQNISMVRTLS